jgi:hypothetical protein
MGCYKRSFVTAHHTPTLIADASWHTLITCSTQARSNNTASFAIYVLLPSSGPMWIGQQCSQVTQAGCEEGHKPHHHHHHHHKNPFQTNRNTEQEMQINGPYCRLEWIHQRGDKRALPVSLHKAVGVANITGASQLSFLCKADNREAAPPVCVAGWSSISIGLARLLSRIQWTSLYWMIGLSHTEVQAILHTFAMCGTSAANICWKSNHALQSLK